MSSRSLPSFPGCPAEGHRHAPADLRGLTAVVTGGASGIGYFTAEGLAARGARVIIAGRDAGKAAAAERAIRREVPGADLGFEQLDLADLSSVRAAARRLSRLPALDILVANAGAIGYPDHVKPRPERGVRPRTTADGHELFWGTNFLGHYALVAALLPLLVASGGRCVFVGSLGDRLAPLPADAVPPPDLQASDLAKYAQSKLATTTLMHEVARRLAAQGSGARALGAHPGTAADALSPPRPGVASNQPDGPRLLRLVTGAVLHGKDEGARPVLAAAVCPEAGNGEYWGPRWLTKGRPQRVRPRPATRDAAAADRLVAASTALTGVPLPI